MESETNEDWLRVCIYIYKIFAPTGGSSGEPFGSIKADHPSTHTLRKKTRAALSLESPSPSMSSPLLGSLSPGADLAHMTVTMPISVMLSPGMSFLLGCVDVERWQVSHSQWQFPAPGEWATYGEWPRYRSAHVSDPKGSKASFERMLLGLRLSVHGWFIWFTRCPNHGVIDSKELATWRARQVLSLRPDGSWPSNPHL